MTSPKKPELSVIIAIVSDTTEDRASVGALVQCLEALSQQVNPPTLELIVPYHEAVDGIDELRRKYPDVNFLATDLKTSSRRGGGREHHDVLRSRGLTVAQGDLICLVEDHALPDENWCANIFKAHHESYAAIGGAIENGIDRPLNWAVYFCDYGKYQNPLPSGESFFASDSNVSYKRSILQSVRNIWQGSFREVLVNGAIRKQGEKVILRPDIIVYQNRFDLRFGAALRERFIWGRSYAGTRNAILSTPKRLVYAALSPVLPLILMQRIAAIAWKRRRNFRKFLRSMHLIAILQISWSLGEFIGYLTGVRESS